MFSHDFQWWTHHSWGPLQVSFQLRQVGPRQRHHTAPAARHQLGGAPSPAGALPEPRAAATGGGAIGWTGTAGGGAGSAGDKIWLVVYKPGCKYGYNHL